MASSAGAKPNHHFVHSIDFWDTDGPEKKEPEEDSTEIEAKMEDLLHNMNKDGDLAHDANKAMSAYND